LTYYSPEPGPRPAPDWLPIGEIEDEVLGLLKTGKEAEVFVVERCSLTDGRSCLLAHKRYRPTGVTTKGELEASGFTRARSFVNDTVYHEGRRFRRSRDKRAVERMTDHGKKLLGDRWIATSSTPCGRCGRQVPMCPIRCSCSMTACSWSSSATRSRRHRGWCRPNSPTMSSARRSSSWSRTCGSWPQHRSSDLSPFNVLWWRGRISIIDFPQSTDLLLNPQGFDLMHRDVVRMCEWFSRKGLRRDPDEIFADLLGAAW